MKKTTILFVILIVSGCYNGISYVHIQGEKINVEVADNIIERQKGLMFREELCYDCGMLFVFQETGKHKFWMKNTSIYLDMLFIDSNMTIVEAYSALPFSEEAYVPKSDIKYVLEINNGRFKDIVGEKILID